MAPKYTLPKQYSYEVADAPEVPGEGRPRRNIDLNNGPLVNVTEGNMYRMLLKSIEANGSTKCLGTRAGSTYSWITYTEMFERVKKIGSAIVHTGVEAGGCVGLYSVNRAEWVITDWACFCYGRTSVPLYDTLGDEAIVFISNQVKFSVLFLSADKIKKIVPKASEIPSLKKLVSFDAVTDEMRTSATNAGLELHTFEEYLTLGKDNASDPVDAKLDDTATVMYTSGTTGMPKGAILTHRNFMVDVVTVTMLGEHGRSIRVSKNDIHMSYLPLAHVFERMIVAACLASGAGIGFYSGSATELLNDMKALKPTFFASVPRLFSRIHSKIRGGVDAKGGVALKLFSKGYDTKIANLKRGHLNHWFWDSLVFGKVRSALGGHVHGMLSGSAPLSPDVLDFLRVSFSCEAGEGYGATETTGITSVTFYGDYEAGTVGPPVPCNEIKLVDVPDMNYTSQDKPYPRGEIWVRGANIFGGYFQDEEKTKEVLTEDGWLRTGDIGLWDEKGRLKIIDRKKNLFKLAQGEYIAPEKIENVHLGSKFVAQSFVFSESLKAYIIAIIIPDEEVIMSWCKDNGVEGTFAEVVKNPLLNQTILDDLTAQGKVQGLKGFELVKAIHLSSELFSVENDTLTPSMKLRRPQARDKYRAEIDQLFVKVDQQGSTASSMM